MPENRPQEYVWLLGDVPCTGTIERYSRHWRLGYWDDEDGRFTISDTVLTWAPGGDPVTWDVQVLKLGRNSAGNIGYRLTIDRDVITFAVREKEQEK